MLKHHIQLFSLSENVISFILMKCIPHRINGAGWPIDGSCRLRGHSNENINEDVKEVCYTTYIRIMMRQKVQ